MKHLLCCLVQKDRASATVDPTPEPAGRADCPAPSVRDGSALPSSPAPTDPSPTGLPYKCLYQGCKAGPFAQEVDLHRHMLDTHKPMPVHWYCDDIICPRSRRGPAFSREDFLDHLSREHGERVVWVPSRDAPGGWDTGKYWRCDRCFLAVLVQMWGKECPDCKVRGYQGC